MVTDTPNRVILPPGTAGGYFFSQANHLFFFRRDKIPFHSVLLVKEVRRMQREALVPGSCDEKEMTRLMDAYSGQLLGVCTLLLSDWSLAQDVVQETFVKAWKLGGYHQESEKAWLMRVAVNLCHDYHRSRWYRHTDRRTTPEELSAAAPAAFDSEIIQLVRQLPLREKEAIILFYWNGCNADEIAAMTRQSRSAVYRQLEKARKHLKLELEGG